jgi:hypothetical protein
MEAPAPSNDDQRVYVGQGCCEWVQVRQLAEQRRVPSGHDWRGESSTLGVAPARGRRDGGLANPPTSPRSFDTPAHPGHPAPQ